MKATLGTPARRSAVLAAAVVAAALLVFGLLAAFGGSARAGSVATGPRTGVVNIDTALGYSGGAASGTGIVLTSSGEVLTNNHVIRGATRIRVTVPSTARTYPATVVGYSLTGDVALLKLANASGLQTATVGNSAGVKVGDRVTAVGNAGGRGGTPTVTTGTITGLHRSITVGDGRSGAVRLADLISTSAALEPGDSGGPLLDRAGRVIGVDTAAGTGVDLGRGGSGFAIPVNRALSLVRTIQRGRTTASVHVGPTSFLGISVSSAERAGGTAGALVSGVLSGSPADDAGLVSGDLITSIAGRAVSSPTGLVTALLRTSPGRAVQIRWTDQSGFTHSRTIRPVAGPPQ